MFKGFANLRASLLPVVFLRRISRALERANHLAESRLALDHPAWYKANKGTLNGEARQPRLAELYNPSVEEWNDEWTKKHPDTDDDEY